LKGLVVRLTPRQFLLTFALAAGVVAPAFAQSKPGAPARSATIPAPATDALARARDFYNQRQYDEAIRLADQARHTPDLADAAGVVFARAHLERYRDSRDDTDLDAARTALMAVADAKLAARDHLDWTIGFGELLYFDRRFNTSAEFFQTALGQLDMLEPGARDRLFEWWASALDQQAQLGPETERQPLYARVLARAEEELRHDNRSFIASYWISAAALGLDDVDRAWAAAEAGWLRAGDGSPASAKLREDLDRLMTSAVIPERAHRLVPYGDPHAALSLLLQDWSDFKDKYRKTQ
jgi:hypothetical protein